MRLKLAMVEAKLFWFAVAGALVVGVIAYALRRGDVGHGRFFADQSYHFQTLRVLNDVPSDGADTAEVLETVKHVRWGDAQGWFRAWSGTGDLGRGPGGSNHRSDRQGPRALRAHNYYRTAERHVRCMAFPGNRLRRPSSREQPFEYRLDQ